MGAAEPPGQQGTGVRPERRALLAVVLGARVAAQIRDDFHPLHRLLHLREDLLAAKGLRLLHPLRPLELAALLLLLLRLLRPLCTLELAALLLLLLRLLRPLCTLELAALLLLLRLLRPLCTLVLRPLRPLELAALLLLLLLLRPLCTLELTILERAQKIGSDGHVTPGVVERLEALARIKTQVHELRQILG